MSNQDIKARIEEILSDILSDKHEAKITIKFVDKKEIICNEHTDSSRGIRKK